ncbi:MAG: metallophosphoesterase [Syntrophobacteraceae bacterium]|nr:metallophosphoesterase [Syntrophobacteraceae bacterium]
MEPSKQIFISDIHMGYDKEVSGRRPYVWFNTNAPFLEKFLDKQLRAADVKAVVILGDLFDQWNIPMDYTPVTTFELICENDTNQQVVAKMKELGLAGKLIYVPGNHDMAMSREQLSPVRDYIVQTFPGIDFRCDTDLPSGKYEDGALIAEHGNRYCLFNAPDVWTNPDSFLPLGYFVTRCVAYQASKTGNSQTLPHIFSNFLKSWAADPISLIGDVFSAICLDEGTGLTLESIYTLDDIPGYNAGALSVGDVKARFSGLYSDWAHSARARLVQANTALINERDTLYEAAELVHFYPGSAEAHEVVIFGHTHQPCLKGVPVADGIQTVSEDPHACFSIYANSGTWVDSAGKGGDYVETEEVVAGGDKRLHVRLKKYTGTEDTVIDWGYVRG